MSRQGWRDLRSRLVSLVLPLATAMVGWLPWGWVQKLGLRAFDLDLALFDLSQVHDENRALAALIHADDLHSLLGRPVRRSAGQRDICDV